MKYAAIMFDVVESRKYYERYDVQKVLMTCVSYLNKIYRCEIKKKVVSSAGDEFQGLFFDILHGTGNLIFYLVLVPVFKRILLPAINSSKNKLNS